MARKVLLIPWIIRSNDEEKFKGMKWANRDEGIFCLYWKHQGSQKFIEEESDVHRAWAIVKKHLKNKEGLDKFSRELKAGFRNALEKKQELERMHNLDTEDYIYWRFRDIASIRHEMAFPPTKSKKQRKSPKNVATRRGFTEPPKQADQPGTSTTLTEFEINDGKPRKQSAKYQKPSRKKVQKKKKIRKIALESEIKEYPSKDPGGGSTDKRPLPSVETLLRHDPWNESSKLPLQSGDVSSTFGENIANLEFWQPQSAFLAQRNIQSNMSSDTLEICDENMDIMDSTSQEFFNLSHQLIRPQLTPDNINTNMNIAHSTSQQFSDYSNQLTPPQQSSNISFGNSTLGTVNLFTNGFNTKLTPLKYTFPWSIRMDEAKNNQSLTKNPYMSPPDSVHNKMKFIPQTVQDPSISLHSDQKLSNLQSYPTVAFDPNQNLGSVSIQNNQQCASSTTFPFYFDVPQFSNTPPIETFDFNFEPNPDTSSSQFISVDKQQHSLLTLPPQNTREVDLLHVAPGDFTTGIKELDYFCLTDLILDTQFDSTLMKI